MHNRLFVMTDGIVYVSSFGNGGGKTTKDLSEACVFTEQEWNNDLCENSHYLRFASDMVNLNLEYKEVNQTQLNFVLKHRPRFNK